MVILSEMDNTNTPAPGQVHNLPQQTPNPDIEPPQPFVQPPQSKKARKLLIIILSVIIVVGFGAAAWLIFGKNEKSNQNSAPQSTSPANCAYQPKQNYPENEGLYSIWRERAKNINFDVYLPCKFFEDFTIAELGVSDEAGGKVFLRFDRPDPPSGDDGLPDNSWFYVQASQEPSPCGASCFKAGDSKFGVVYKDNYEDLYLTVGKSLIVWSSPPYDETGNIEPMIDVLNSLQKIDPTKLEFFNG